MPLRKTSYEAKMSEKRESSIELVPWDCESDEHVERMYNQRVSCGWRCDEVREQWIELTRAGKKTLYWVVSLGSYSRA